MSLNLGYELSVFQTRGNFEKFDHRAYFMLAFA